MKKYPLYIFTFLIFLSSCTATLEVEKRKYQKGYHVAFSFGDEKGMKKKDIAFDNMPCSSQFTMEDKKEVEVKQNNLSPVFSEQPLIPEHVAVADTIKPKTKKLFFAKSKSDATEQETTHQPSWPKYLLFIGIAFLIAGLLLMFEHFLGEILTIIGLLMLVGSLISFACRLANWQRYLSLIGFLVELVGMVLITMVGPFGAIVLLFGALIELAAFIYSFVSPKWKNILFTGLMLLTNFIVMLIWALYSSGG